jgi:hypothetical protein
MIIGLATPAFSPFQWSPLPALKTNPSSSNTHLSLFHETDVILLIRHLLRDTYHVFAGQVGIFVPSQLRLDGAFAERTGPLKRALGTKHIATRLSCESPDP